MVLEIRVEFYTETFQTTPVMFKEIRLMSSSSSISLNPELTLEHNQELFGIFINISLRFKNFEGGENGTTLFEVTGLLAKDDRRLMNLKAH